MAIIINFIFNWFVLWKISIIPVVILWLLCKEIFNYFFETAFVWHIIDQWHLWISTSYRWAFLTFVIQLSLMLLMASSFGDFILRSSLGLRDPILRERHKLIPICQHLQQQIIRDRRKKIAYSLHVTDYNALNAAVFGRKRLIVTTGAMNNFSKEELTSAIAHEFGHLYYQDSVRLSLLVGASLATMLTYWVLKKTVEFFDFLSVCGDQSKLFWIQILFMPFQLVAIVFMLAMRLIDFIWDLILHAHLRWQEYRADRFAVDLGHGIALISCLEKIAQFEETQHGWWSQYFSSHPPLMKRVGRIEKLLYKKQSGVGAVVSK